MCHISVSKVFLILSVRRRVLFVQTDGFVQTTVHIWYMSVLLKKRSEVLLISGLRWRLMKKKKKSVLRFSAIRVQDSKSNKKKITEG